MAFETASVLGPDYEDMTPMSVGGLGELFRAHKRGLDVEVVVKRVKSQYQYSDNETHEANILKNLRHQFLPRIYDIIYADDGFIYTVMDYIPGCNLQEYVDKHGALNQKQALKWMRQLSAVTEYLHELTPPVLHCDIKPQNIMITPRGDICLIDFNTSLIFDNPDMNALGVTNGYAAPEQYRISQKALSGMTGQDKVRWEAWSKAAKKYGTISERTDIYAIGAVGYFMLTGYTPAHSMGEVVPLSEYDITVSDAFRAAIERAMSAMPRNRFPNAKALTRALSNDDLKKAEKSYRAWKRSCQITAVAISVLLMLSLFSIWTGFRMRADDKSVEYMELIAQADEQISKLDYDRGLETLAKAIAIDDSRIEAYSRTATILYRSGKYSECEALLSEASFVYKGGAMTREEFNFAQAEIDYLLGSCYFNDEEYERAIYYLSLAAQFDGAVPIYFRDLAVTEAVVGRVGDARDDLASLIAAGGEENDVLLVEAEIYYAEGNYASATEKFLQLTASRDGSVSSRAYLRAAQCLKFSGDVDREIEILEAARATLDPSMSYAHCEQLSDAYLRRASLNGSPEDLESALEICQSLEDRGMASLNVRLNMALALQYLGRTDEALEALGEITADYPNSYRGFMRLTFLYLDARVENYDAARESYARAWALYSGSGAQDGEMTYLKTLMEDLTASE